jgi:hypothetical protein
MGSVMGRDSDQNKYDDTSAVGSAPKAESSVEEESTRRVVD